MPPCVKACLPSHTKNCVQLFSCALLPIRTCSPCFSVPNHKATIVNRWTCLAAKVLKQVLIFSNSGLLMGLGKIILPTLLLQSALTFLSVWTFFKSGQELLKVIWKSFVVLRRESISSLVVSLDHSLYQVCSINYHPKTKKMAKSKYERQKNSFLDENIGFGSFHAPFFKKCWRFCHIAWVV